MKRGLCIALSLSIAISGRAEEISRETKSIAGFTVQIDKRLLKGGDLHEDFGRRAITRLYSDLGRISLLIPEEPLSEMRKVTIVVDEHPELKGAQYHPSRDWLVDNGHEASLAKCVHVSKASLFASADHFFVQPSMMMHELAHAYHDQVLGWDFDPIKKAFARAKLDGRYEEVLFVKGGKRRHYALTNHKEYFAEATEAWFGTNDFYPFVRSELEEHDPRLFAILKEIWGEN